MAHMEELMIRRSEQGYRVGQDHQRASCPDSAVDLARTLREQGVKLAAIVVRLRAEGVVVTWRTVKAWCLFDRRNVTPREREDRVPTHRTVR